MGRERRAATRPEPITVVGATSPLGRRLVTRLLETGRQVRCVVRNPTKIPRDWRRYPCEVRLWDVARTTSVATVIGNSLQVVWLAHVHEASPWQQLLVNTKMIEAICCTRRHLVFVSSGGSVYGEPEYLLVGEDHPRRPLSPYGVAKCVMEDVILTRGQGSVVGAILRPGNIYGREYLDRTAKGVIGAFVRNLLDGTPITLRDQGRGARDFVHVDDVVDAIVLALSWSRSLVTWNVGTGIPTETAKILQILCAILNRAPSAVFHQPREVSDVRAIALNASRISSDCGWKPSYSLIAGLRDAVGVASHGARARTKPHVFAPGESSASHEL